MIRPWLMIKTIGVNVKKAGGRRTNKIQQLSLITPSTTSQHSKVAFCHYHYVVREVSVCSANLVEWLVNVDRGLWHG